VNKKVLVIDDDKDFSFILKTSIQKWGYEPLITHTAKEGLSAAGQNKDIGIMIIDYKLPDLDGISLLKDLRKTGNKTPAVILTAFPGNKIFRNTDELSIRKVILKLRIGTETLNILKSTIEEVLAAS